MQLMIRKMNKDGMLLDCLVFPVQKWSQRKISFGTRSREQNGQAASPYCELCHSHSQNNFTHNIALSLQLFQYRFIFFNEYVSICNIFCLIRLSNLEFVLGKGRGHPVLDSCKNFCKILLYQSKLRLLKIS